MEEQTNKDNVIEKRMVFEGNGVVWDKDKGEKGGALCRFKNGKFITDNPMTIKKLKEKGYKWQKYNPQEQEKEVTPEGEIERLGQWIFNNYPADEGFPVDIAIRIMNNMKTLQDTESINKKDMKTLVNNPYAGGQHE